MIANTNSPHTEKWALALCEQGIDVHLFSIDVVKEKLPWRNSLKSHFAAQEKDRFLPRKYFRLLKQLKLLIKKIKPDIVHAHYLSNYASLGVLSGFHPLVITAWGSDVFQYPKQSFINAFLLKWVIKKADACISTSEVMKRELSLYTTKEITVIPFGVDFDRYIGAAKKDEIIRIGIFKRLEKVYGLDRAIMVLPNVQKQLSDLKIELHVFGNGSEEEFLKKLSQEMQCRESVIFHGWTKPEAVPTELEKLDLCLYLSERESFGVALIEAMAAQKAMVVSDIPAFNDVAKNYAAVSFVNPFDLKQITAALVHQIRGLDISSKPSNTNARQQFDIKQNIRVQIELYEQLLKKNK